MKEEFFTKGDWTQKNYARAKQCDIYCVKHFFLNIIWIIREISNYFISVQYMRKNTFNVSEILEVLQFSFVLETSQVKYHTIIYCTLIIQVVYEGL